MAWTPWGEVDIPFLQNPFTNKNQGSIPFLQNPFNGKPGVSAGFLPTMVRSAKPGQKPVNKSAPAPTQGVTGADMQAVMGTSGGGGFGYSGGAGGGDEPNAAEVDQIRNEARARANELIAAYTSIFGNLDRLAKDRSRQVESQYGDQLTQAADQYTEAIPTIENSYSAIGAGDSTDNTYAKNDAKEGFDSTTRQIKKNKDTDLSKVGSFIGEQKARYGAERDNAKRLSGRLDQTEDLADLRASRNQLEDKLSSTKADAATLTTDAGARGQLSKITGDNGRSESVMDALDNIIKGSMSGAVKDAAVKSVIDSAGLSEEEKKKVQIKYGNTYAEQAAL